MEDMREVTKTILQRTREPDTGENNQDNGSGRRKNRKENQHQNRTEHRFHNKTGNTK